MDMLELDGSVGEGGGQILRTALSLSMVTGRPFRMTRIRAGRPRPGLLRQHMVAVGASAEICGARVSGLEPGSQALTFVPGRVRGGDYRFAIGSAGSTTLVLQTLLPALWHADAPSTVEISGGTHNSAAPTADFLLRAWVPHVRAIGASVDIDVPRHGFYPAGGGRLVARTVPVARLDPLHLLERGTLRGARVESIVAAVPADVARREIEAVSRALAGQLPDIGSDIRLLPANEGPGNVLQMTIASDATTEVFSAFGERGRPAALVADALVRQVRAYLAGTAPVGEHLADQIMLPASLAGGSRFRCTTVSSHCRTVVKVIEAFLPLSITLDEAAAGAEVVVARRDG